MSPWMCCGSGHRDPGSRFWSAGQRCEDRGLNTGHVSERAHRPSRPRAAPRGPFHMAPTGPGRHPRAQGGLGAGFQQSHLCLWSLVAAPRGFPAVCYGKDTSGAPAPSLSSRGTCAVLTWRQFGGHIPVLPSKTWWGGPSWEGQEPGEWVVCAVLGSVSPETSAQTGPGQRLPHPRPQSLWPQSGAGSDHCTARRRRCPPSLALAAPRFSLCTQP